MEPMTRLGSTNLLLDCLQPIHTPRSSPDLTEEGLVTLALEDLEKPIHSLPYIFILLFLTGLFLLEKESL